MDERRRMIELYQIGWTQSDLAREFGLTWRCVHKWIKRFGDDPEHGLEERSRAPRTSSQRKTDEAVAALIELKKRFPRFGPAKLVTFLSPAHRMAASTASDVLKDHGMVKPRRPRRGTVLVNRRRIIVPGPGHTMTTDYKGHFRMGSGRYCYPLTMAEPVSRYILAVDGFMSIDGADAKRSYERVFREHGVPEQVVHDGGSPFCAAAALAAISELTKWWIHLGILPIRIDPGRPQQNGRLERMHLDLKEWTAQPSGRNLREQQKRFDEFRDVFNNVRPHQSHGQRPPASFFVPFRRQYPSRLPEIVYDDSFILRRVRHSGEIRWKGYLVYLSGVLAGEIVGLKQVADEWWDIYFGPLHIARWDDRKKHILRVEAVGQRASHQGEKRVDRPDGGESDV
jgi:putative transposase